MNRKAQFDSAVKTVYWTIAGFVIVIVILVFAITLAGYKDHLTAVPPELKAELTSFRFINNPDCFALQETNSGKTMASIIDLKKFNQTVLDDCYKTDDDVIGIRQMNFQLVLRNFDRSLSTNNYKDAYQDKLTLKEEVLVWSNNKMEKDILLIYVQDI